mmetsp:Transcript_43181/g.91771  ORF Transcript_43181/g.91771 Transcript_43181/m.91771 type:complete len:80 (-) Transcript_43181:190-429(-)
METPRSAAVGLRRAQREAGALSSDDSTCGDEGFKSQIDSPRRDAARLKVALDFGNGRVKETTLQDVLRAYLVAPPKRQR